MNKHTRQATIDRFTLVRGLANEIGVVDRIEENTMLLAFLRSADRGSSYYQLSGGIVDSYQDQTGINASASSGYSYDSTGKYFYPRNDGVDSYTVLALNMDVPSYADLAAYIPSSAYMQIANHSDWNFSGQFCLEGWFWFENVSGAKTLFSRNNDAEWGLQWDSASGGIFGLQVGGTGYNFSMMLTAGRWYHIAATRNASNSATVWVNGVNLGFQTLSGSASGSGAVRIGLRASGSYPFSGYVRDIRISNVVRYTANFTPSTSGFTVDSNTVLYIKGNDGNGATSFADSETVPKTVTTSGSIVCRYMTDYRDTTFIDSETTAKIVTAVGTAKQIAGVYNNTAIFFNGTTDFLLIPNTADFNFGTGNMTIEGWFMFSSTSSVQELWNLGSYLTPVNRCQVFNGGNLYWSLAGSTVITYAWAPPINTWFHIACVRSGTGSGQCSLYINGIQVATGTSSGNVQTGSGTNIIGSYQGGGQYFSGWMKEFRVSNTNRYTSTFTPSTRFTSDSNTKLLLHGDSPATTPLAPAIYFDGSGDYITISDAGQYDIGTGDFTVEAWCWYPTLTGSPTIFNTDPYTSGILFRYSASDYGTLTIGVANSFKDWLLSGVSSSLPLTSAGWVHFAISRKSGFLYGFVNGVSAGAPIASTESISVTTGIQVGRRSEGSDIYTGYMKGLRWSSIARYTDQFTPSTSEFVADGYTIFLMNGAEMNGATTFQDLSGKAITAAGNARISDGTDVFIDYSSAVSPKEVTANGNAKILPYKFNKSAAFFAGGNFVRVPDHADWDFGTGDFTVETFVNFQALTTDQYIFHCGTSDVLTIYWHTGAGGTLSFNVANVGWGVAFVPVIGTWYHIQCKRTSGVLSIYIDGALRGTSTNAGSIAISQDLCIGNYNLTQSTTYAFKGWMKEFRISNISRAAGVPTTQYTADSNTKLLLHFDTPATAPLCPAIYFDGTGDYLTVPDSNDWDFGTGDFTIESWVYQDPGYAAANTIYDNGYDVNGMMILFYWDDASGGYISVYLNSGSATLNVTGLSMKRGRWNHLAVCRASGTLRIFIDGRQVGSVSNSTSVSGSTQALTIGKYYNAASSPLKGFLKEYRVSNVARYTSAFTPSQTGFTVDANTKLYIKGNENNGATTFADSCTSPKTITTYSDTKIRYTEDYRNCIFPDSSTATQKYPYPQGLVKVDFVAAMGAGSVYLDSSSSFLRTPDSADWDFGTGDFTIEAYVKFDQLGRWEPVISVGASSVYNTWVFLGKNDGNDCVIYVESTSYQVAWPNIVANQWFHYALSRQSGSVKVWINGTQVGVTQTITTSVDCPDVVDLGHFWSGGSHYYFKGFMDNARISNTARYTATFNPPTTVPTADSYDKLLLPMDPVTPKFGNLTMGYFDGSGDYLAVQNSPDFTFLGGDFTIDTWVFERAYPSSYFTIYNHFVDTSNYFSWYLYTLNPGAGTQGMCISLYNNATFQFINWSVEVPFSINEWHHVALVRKGNSFLFFRDGVLFDSFVSSVQIPDFNGTVYVGSYSTSMLYFNGYMQEYRVSKGIARWTANFTPPTAEYTADSYTKLLLQFKGNHLSAIFCDSSSTSAKTVTTYGDTKIRYYEDCRGRCIIDSSASQKYISNYIGKAKVDFVSASGTGAGLFGGGAVDNCVTIPDSADVFLNADHTYEGYVKFFSSNGTFLWGQSQDATNSIAMNWVTPTLLFRHYIGNSNVLVVSATWTPNLGVWYHIAGTRYGNVWTIWVNGVSVATVTQAVTVADLTGNYKIGSDAVTWSYYGSVMIDAHRLSKGIARYTASFIPPTNPLAGTQNMTLQSIPFSAATVPSDMRIVIQEQDVDSVTLNTDIKAYVSRDGGVTFNQVTLANEGSYEGTKRVLAVIQDVASQPSGTAPVYKIVTANNKNLKLYGTALNWA